MMRQRNKEKKLLRESALSCQDQDEHSISQNTSSIPKEKKVFRDYLVAQDFIQKVSLELLDEDDIQVIDGKQELTTDMTIEVELAHLFLEVNARVNTPPTSQASKTNQANVLEAQCLDSSGPVNSPVTQYGARAPFINVALKEYSHLSLYNSDKHNDAYEFKNSDLCSRCEKKHNEGKVVGQCIKGSYYIKCRSSPCEEEIKIYKELDSAFNIPNVKLIKQTIQSAYNCTFPLIQKFVKNNAISINLTTDMWTGRNRQGFLGGTCSFLNKNFTIHEVILTIEYIRYLHITQNISDALFVILDEWNLRDKTYVIVTNNRMNMKKAIKEMNNITSNIKWQPCTTYTLQLVMEKSLNSVKLLVLKNAGKTSKYFLQVFIDIFIKWNLTYYALMK
ncbi:unnamed protein product [Rhizophagus irregularis]|nr:unnamed protein product [Rhizophagus irregularis]